jgi:hypothetical protein
MLRIAGREITLQPTTSRQMIAKSPAIWLNSPLSALKSSLAA